MLELAAAAALLIIMAGFLAVQAEAWQHYHYKSQVRLAAQTLAADLRQLQQQTLFLGKGAGWSLKIPGSKASKYAVYNGYLASSIKKRVDFAKLGCGDVYFASQISSVYFSNTGAPAVTGFYVLRHKRLAGYSCRITVQPVTGRVSVYEEK